MALEQQSDEELIARAGRGDRAAASMIVTRYASPVYSVCFRMLGGAALAEDATQETFMRMWRTAPKWKDRGAKFSSWLYKVASNVCLDHLRKTKHEAPEEAVPEQIDHAPQPDETLLRGERRAMIGEAISKLPERQRLAITLCHFQEMSNIEAADVMNVSVDALESLLARGRRKLKTLLAGV